MKRWYLYSVSLLVFGALGLLLDIYAPSISNSLFFALGASSILVPMFIEVI